MSTENVETIRRLYERVLAPGRVTNPATGEIVPEFFHPDVEIHQTAAMFDSAGTFHGYEGLTEAAREIIQMFSGLGYFPERVEAARDKVAVEVLVRATGRQSGAAVEWRVSHLWVLRDGRVTRWDVFDDPAEAFQAGGIG